MLRNGADTWEDVYHDATQNRTEREELKEWGWTRKPSIHMPRWASRIQLEIVNVRVERIQDISNGDIGREGACRDLAGEIKCNDPSVQCDFECWKPLWDSINAKRGFGWDMNPWVWVVEFNVA